MAIVAARSRSGRDAGGLSLYLVKLDGPGVTREALQTIDPTRSQAKIAFDGAPAPGYSSGQAQKAIEEVLRSELPNGMTYEWTDLTYQQILAGNTMSSIFP